MNSVDRRVSSVCKAAVIIPALMLSVADLAYGQTGSAKEVIVANTPNVNVTNTPAVRIDAANNTVRLTNTQADPLPVSVAGSAVRRPFHAGINVSIAEGGTFSVARVPIPAGKRLVIEDVSAVTFQPQGQGLLLDFMTFVEDSIGETNPRGGFEIHNVVLLSQGEFNGLDVSVAHEKVVVFADEAVGTTTGLYIEVHLARGSATGSAGVRVTFSGYVEDLPTAPLVRR